MILMSFLLGERSVFFPRLYLGEIRAENELIVLEIRTLETSCLKKKKQTNMNQNETIHEL